jgi:hypothetical protein
MPRGRHTNVQAERGATTFVELNFYHFKPKRTFSTQPPQRDGRADLPAESSFPS